MRGWKREQKHLHRDGNPHYERGYSPRYLLRRRLVLHLLRRYKPGRFLEIGCGSGELMPWLLQYGFEGVGLEVSPQALPFAQEAVRPYEPRLQVINDASMLHGHRFQYVLALEVLEHIEDDQAALVAWKDWLEPGGKLILSVPAHMDKWTATDEAVGHYRRYEKNRLQQLLTGCGYAVEVFWNYGFPLTALTRPLRHMVYRLRLRREPTLTQQERILQSSFESTWTVGRGNHLFRLIAEGGGFTFHLLQLPFRRFDVGDGFLVSCQRAQ
jgi:SAM-dependent methyltransferase